LRRRSQARPTGVLLLAAVVAYALFFYRDVLFQQRVAVFRDQYTIVLAIDYVVRALSQFDWPPLWTPFQVLGKPLAADPLSAVYYPFNWFLRLLPWPLGYNASLALHHLWAAVGMYCLLRHRSISRLAAGFGAVLFGFGGLFVSFDNMINALQSAAWAPWTLLAFDMWCVRPAFATLAATAVGLAMTLLGGMPEVFLFENTVFVALVVDRWHGAGRPTLARAAAACFAANLLAIGIGAVQLVPTAEYLLQSSRVSGLNPAGVMRLALRPLGVFAFLLPRHYVDPSGRFHEIAALWEGDLSDAPWALTLYLGPALAFAAAAGGMLSRFQRRWWLAVGMVFLALALGPLVPGYRWAVENVSLLRAVRYPEKFLLVVHGLLCVAAALGFESALREPQRFRIVRRVAIVFAAIAVLAALAVHLRPSFERELLATDLLIATAGFALVAGLASLGRVRPQGAALAFLALAAIDLYRVNGQLLPTVAWSETLREPSSALGIRRGNDPLRIYSDAIGRPAVPSFPDGFLQEQNLLLMEVANYYGIANLNAPSSINLRDHELLASLTEHVPRQQVAPLFAALNTAYVTSPKDLQRYPGLVPVLKPTSTVEAYVYEVEGVTPRAFVAPTLEPVADAPAALGYMHGSVAPAERVAVERSAIPPGLPAAMAGSVRIETYRPQEIELAASMQSDGLVVLSDSFYPGWEATIDGQPAPIVRANYFARGVFVPAGEHRVVFTYRPLSFRVGAIVSILTCALVLLGLATSSIRRP
jgi:Bacterial membrane protein YfhO